jgi:hypothetical protein
MKRFCPRNPFNDCQNFKKGCISFIKNDKILEEEWILPNGIFLDEML